MGPDVGPATTTSTTTVCSRVHQLTQVVNSRMPFARGMVLFRHSEPRKFSDLLIGQGNFPLIPCSVLGIYKEGVPLFQATQFPVHFYQLLLELPRGFNVRFLSAPSWSTVHRENSGGTCPYSSRRVRDRR